MVSRSTFLLILLAVLISASAIAADIPRLVTYQGRLTDNVGMPVPDASYSVDFILYDDSTSGSQLWAETHTVETVDGLFNAKLGLHASLDEPIFIDHTNLFIAMQLSGHPEMAPRMRLTSGAFCYQSFHANQADIAFAAVVGGGWRDDGNVVRLDIVADSVGIGTSTPEAKLDIIGDAMIRGKTTFGTNQTNTGDGAAISGGADNIAEGIVSTISGGQSNVASGDGSTIAGGAGNQATNNGATVGGGYFNYARGRSSVIGGGGNLGAPTDSNSALGDYSVIGGGTRNLAAAYGSVIGGGDLNATNGQGAIIGGGAENDADGSASTIAGGGNNKTYGDFTAIGGGGYNRAHGAFSVIAGGGGSALPDSNTTIGDHSAILGGRHNTAAGLEATIGGGVGNSTNGNQAAVCGGMNNQASASSAFVGGGDNNVADGSRAVIAGGGINHAEGSASVIAGGSFNYAPGEHAVIGGGQGNFARGEHSVIGGGGGATNSPDTNSASGDYSVISGGIGNVASGDSSFIGGGGNNTASAGHATVAGGKGNTASSTYATVGGGLTSTACNLYAVVAGGYNNLASAIGAAVAGGHDNLATAGGSTVGGGSYNSASGNWSTVVGGYDNAAAGNFSFAAGSQAKALHHGTFVWADSAFVDFQSTHNNQFLIRASGGVGIGTVSPGAMLDVADDDRALRLRAGNGQAEYADNQILLSYDGSVNYSHAIKSRHSGSTSARNAIDFYVWDQAVDGALDVGSKHVLTIDGDNNGEVGIGTTEPNYTLDVRGTIGNNTTTYHSDERWKMDVRTIPDALDKVAALRGVDFRWRQDDYKEMNFPPGEHLGVIAQEVEKVLPQVVHTDDNGYKSVEYANLTALLIEAVKELKAENDELRKRIADVEGRFGR